MNKRQVSCLTGAVQSGIYTANNKKEGCPMAAVTRIKRTMLLSCLFLLTACGGGGETPVTLIEPTETSANPNQAPALENTPVVIHDHLGSLYNAFVWAGPIRDPMRDDIEIKDAASFVPLSDSATATLTDLARERDIIMQIGGMGSAKPGSEPGQPSERFSDYMNGILADDGEQWRDAVAERAREVVTAQPDGSTIYWQVGNEINADSYKENVSLYFDEDTQGLSIEDFTIQVYVEYFFAPTAQAFREAEADTGQDVAIALGSIAGISAQTEQDYLDNLLSYEIQGTFAPDLAGMQVAELTDLITLHYLGQAATPDDPARWYTTLETIHDKWVGDNIRGVWNTEEVGIRMASNGAGAAAALLVQSRYWQWISENHLTQTEASWFYYGTRSGPEGQRIDDSLTQVHNLVGSDGVTHINTVHDLDNRLDVYLFYVEAQDAYLVTASSLVDEPLEIREILIDDTQLSHIAETKSTQGWYYGLEDSLAVGANSTLSDTRLIITLDGAVTLTEKPETLLFWLK